jgi:evolved beta-galactosidase subunit beta
MTLFASREDLAAGHHGVTKWERLLLALDNAHAVRPGAAHSVGDSLTYWRESAATLGGEALVGHRRYQTVLAVLDGEAQVELAPRSGLVPLEPYSDLTDRERFTPVPDGGDVVTVSRGQILAVPIDHAWRIEQSRPADLLVVRLTVEGATFHNK